MKKIRFLSLFLAIILIVSLAACSGGSTPAESQPAESANESAAPASEAPASEAPASEAPETVVAYPIAGDHTFSIVSVIRRNTAEILGDGDFSDTPVYEQVVKETGVNVEFQMLAEATYEEKINLMMVSNDLPDIFSQTVAKYDSNLSGAIADDVLVDLEPLLVEHAPDYKKILDSDQSFAEGVYNSDGTLSQFSGRVIPRVSQGLYIRGDWLEKVGMDVPATIDELTDVLVAFKNECGATNAVLVNRDVDSGLTYAFNALFNGFRGISFQLTAPDSGKVECALASEGYIKYLLYMHDLYTKGVVNDDFMNIAKENGNWESSYYSGVCGVWYDDCKIAAPVFAQNASDPNWQAVPFALTGETSHVVQTTNVAFNGKLYITTVCADPEIATEFVNYFYTDAGKDLVAFGIKDETYTVDADGNYAYTDLMLSNPGGWTFDQANVLYTPNQWVPTDQQQRYLDLQFGPEATAAYQLWTSEYGDDSMVLPVGATLTPEETEEFYSYMNDVVTLFSEASSRVVVGETDEAGYRKAIEDANSSGLARMTELYQAAYDRYASK